MNKPIIAYNEIKPEKELTDFIKSYWYFNIKTNTKEIFNIIPDGCFDLLIVIKNGDIRNTLLTGIWSKSIKIEYTCNTRVIGIRFKPLALSSLLSLNLRNFLNNSASIHLPDISLNPNKILDLYFESPHALVNYFNSTFKKILLLSNIDARFKNFFNLVEKNNGSLPIKDISYNIGLSTRQLNRKLNHQFGISPKNYSKIIKFNKTLKYLNKNKNDFGQYYDQSHFIKDFKTYIGHSPNKINLYNNVRFLQYYNFQ